MRKVVLENDILSWHCCYVNKVGDKLVLDLLHCVVQEVMKQVECNNLGVALWCQAGALALKRGMILSGLLNWTVLQFPHLENMCLRIVMRVKCANMYHVLSAVLCSA